jgi:hypothetical protein
MDLGVDICSEETEGINTLSYSGTSSGMQLGSLLPIAAASNKRKLQIQLVVEICALRRL